MHKNQINTENKINIKSTKTKSLHNLRYKLVIGASLILAIIITAYVGMTLVPNEINTYGRDYITIIDMPLLLNSLQTAQDDGVTIAIHGWEHEDYTNLTHAEAASDLHNASATFDAVGLHTTVFVSPYEIANISETQNTLDDIALAGLTIPFNAAEKYEYTWEWRNMTSFGDHRYMKATSDIKNNRPHLLVLHAQDWNIYTQKLLTDYLSTTDDRNIIVRMDDLDIYTKPEVVEGMDAFRAYPSVGEVMVAVIPAMAIIPNKDTSPIVYNIPVSSIMKMYFVFFMMTAMFPISFMVMWKITAEINGRKYKKELLRTKWDYPELVSIIVPAYNEEKAIARCIESLLSQDYRGAKEIIVVNDGSSDNTAKIIAQYPVTLLDLKKNGGKANALNAAIKIAQGEVLVFSDGDSNMSRDAISSLIRCFNANPDVDMVTGNVLINKPKRNNLITYCQMVEYHLEQEVARYLQGLNARVIVCPGPITAVKKNVCEVIQYSDETIVEDADFTVCALKKSMKIILDPYAKVYTNAPTTLKGWYKQRKRWWYGNLQVWNTHKKWAITNPWMIYNYMGYVTSLCSLLMLMAMPYLIMQYSNVGSALAKGLIYLLIPIAIYISFTAIFFWGNKKLILMLIPYMLVYPMLKMFVLSYIYVCYLTGFGMKIQFGSRIFKVK